jgi:hypothetical protein
MWQDDPASLAIRITGHSISVDHPPAASSLEALSFGCKFSMISGALLPVSVLQGKISSDHCTYDANT